jgi:hypothetical protein
LKSLIVVLLNFQWKKTQKLNNPSGRLEYVCENKCNVLVYSKTTNIFQKKFKWFLVFMKVEGVSDHVISHNMNHVWIPSDSFENFHFKK